MGDLFVIKRPCNGHCLMDTFMTTGTFSAGSGTEQGLDQTGLTEEANYGLPEGSLNTGHPCQPFDWSAAPLPSHPEDQQPQSLQDQHQPAGDRQQSAGDKQQSAGDKQQSAGDVQQSAGHGEEHQHGRPDLHLYQQPPEDLITCQRDAPDPLAKPVPPKSGKARGVRGPVHGVKGPASRSTPSKGKASSSSVQRGQSTSTADAPYQAAEPEPAHPHRCIHLPPAPCPSACLLDQASRIFDTESIDSQVTDSRVTACNAACSD